MSAASTRPSRSGSRTPGDARSARLFADGAVKLAGKRAAKGDFVAAGDVIELAMHAPSATGDALRADRAIPTALAALVVLLERGDLVAVCKPAGMPSQPLRAGELGTAANGIAARWSGDARELGDDVRDGGLVHRLDVGTSGVLVAARTVAAYRGALRERVRRRPRIAKTVPGDRGRGKPVATECEAAIAQRGDHVVVDAVDRPRGAHLVRDPSSTSDGLRARALHRAHRSHAPRSARTSRTSARRSSATRATAAPRSPGTTGSSCTPPR